MKFEMPPAQPCKGCGGEHHTITQIITAACDFVDQAREHLAAGDPFDVLSDETIESVGPYAADLLLGLALGIAAVDQLTERVVGLPSSTTGNVRAVCGRVDDVVEQHRRDEQARNN